jgi:hypothetical protein
MVRFSSSWLDALCSCKVLDPKTLNRTAAGRQALLVRIVFLLVRAKLVELAEIPRGNLLPAVPEVFAHLLENAVHFFLRHLISGPAESSRKQALRDRRSFLSSTTGYVGSAERARRFAGSPAATEFC